MTVTAVLLLRLVPYAIVAYLAAKKGFRWLVVFALYLIAAALINVTFTPDPNTRALISSGAAIILLLHVLNLRTRKGGDHVI